MNHLPVGLKCYMIRPGYRVLDGITLQEGGVFNLEANEWSGARKKMSPRYLLHYYNCHVSQVQDAAIYNPLQFIFVTPTDGPLWKGERLDLRTILDQGLTPEQLGKIGMGAFADALAAAAPPAAASSPAPVPELPSPSPASSPATAAAKPLDCLPVGLRCYMRRPGHGMLKGITLQKGGLFNVEANEWSEARKNLYHPRHLLHYYNCYVSKIPDAAIYNPFDFIFVAEGGFCEFESLRDILERDWTKEQLSMVGCSSEAFPPAAAASFATTPYSSIQSTKIDVAAVMARLDAEVAAAAAREQEEGELEELLPPASVPDAVPAVAVAVETFCTSEAGKRLLDSCGGFEKLRPRVCERLDPDCVQTNILSLDGDIHWVKVTPKGAALWDELRAIQRHMKALRELCK